MQKGIPSKTADIVCLYRALENVWQNKNSLLKDSFARHFLSKRNQRRYHYLSPGKRKEIVKKLTLGLFDWIILRHAFIDNLVVKFGNKMPVILLGAGYDSRGFRLKEFIKKDIYEFDFPATQQRKLEILQKQGFKNSSIKYFEVDFIKQSLTDIFASTGLENQPALIIWEGVSMYVGEATVRKTIASVKKYFSTGSVFVADYFHDSVNRLFEDHFLKLMPIIMKILYNEPFLFQCSTEKFTELALEEGAKEVESLSAEKIKIRLNIKNLEPFDYCSICVLSF